MSVKYINHPLKTDRGRYTAELMKKVVDKYIGGGKIWAVASKFSLASVLPHVRIYIRIFEIVQPRKRQRNSQKKKLRVVERWSLVQIWKAVSLKKKTTSKKKDVQILSSNESDSEVDNFVAILADDMDLETLLVVSNFCLVKFGLRTSK